MNIHLSVELRAFVRAKVRGGFDSESEVVSEGLRLLAALDRIWGTRLDRQHEEIEAALDGDFDAISRRAAGRRDDAC